jgi:protein gp37/ParB-like chromosome segregation protein Spo0J
MPEFGEYKVHPVAALFPLINDEELGRLAADIKKNRLLDPIILSNDGTTIIDGRNRWRACDKLKIKPRFQKLSASYDEAKIINLIISKNIQRRHLNPGQTGMIALLIEPILTAAAKERMAAGGKRGRQARKGVTKSSPPLKLRVRAQLAEMFNIAEGTLTQAKKVKESSPDLTAEVVAGTMRLNQAYMKVRRTMAIAQVAAEREAASKHKTIVRTHDGQEVQYDLPKAKPKFNKTNDQVSWAAWTWNPITGCLHNCKYCYAREGALYNENLKPFYPFGFEPAFYEYRLEAPRNSPLPDGVENDPRLGRVFVVSMGDLFGKWVPDEWIERVFAAARTSPEWEYLFLTKFPQRYVGLDLPASAWIGTTVDEQYRVKIAEEAFRKIKGVRVKWLSLEPLLSPLEFTDLSMFDFVVIGSQSATRQPGGFVKEFAPKIEWVMKLTQQAKQAGCAVYHKPNLIGVVDAQHAGMKLLQEVPNLPDLPSRNRQGKLQFRAA